MKNKTYRSPARQQGYAGLGDYAVIGEGRSVALIAPDGAIDWWCVPNLDSPPLFDRILDAPEGGYFALTPEEEWEMSRSYRENSNVLETRYKTASGEVLITESINSTFAGRLPWSEMARRVEGIKGHVRLKVQFKPGTRARTCSPWLDHVQEKTIFHLDDLMIALRLSEDVETTRCDDEGMEGSLITAPGSHSLVALVATEKEPLAMPPLEKIDQRIETSHLAWRDWAENLCWNGPFGHHVKRSALALKFLWYAPTGALAASATTSLPEGLGKEKNYDYRYAWVRDACLIIKSFVYMGAIEDCKAAFSWLTSTIIRHDGRLRACYTLEGGLVPEERYPQLEGYQGTEPVRVGNNARDQFQPSMYGDLLATARLFVEVGHVLDLATSRLLGHLANRCADRWRLPDSGIWELPEERQYTHSKMACWLALDQAVALAEIGHIEPTWKGRWARERDRISEWIETHCWSESRQAYTFYAGSETLDAAISLTHYYGSKINRKRMLSTLEAIYQELGHNSPMLYRYSGVEVEESTFVACAFWRVEALAELKKRDQAQKDMKEILDTLCQSGNVQIFNEMYDTRTGGWRGNMPLGLSHLSLICAANALSEENPGHRI
ncbi:Glucoamylase and related glycosyl hydrolases [Cronobacter dublinensis 1210]|uniref:Glucoamylase and related glycosyl hydrolases n=1 Tax=Cronobacter dublinensis 1210 TaxID=1208656 RepID=A0ABM9Q781_9ENTR|nr:glycoside hydrolase family 15 protein [Cronobacter dublinensis]ALB65782.1 glycoside hydrolase family 15 [Cronobacter dublinensis subsp. dublinensis LMG 23823]MDI7272282.1 glycoside hydrolase family 15 protein [Cronobacter dublinensis]CCJ81308.1 Glucoamylase and related glycosyl hydrolases [Cronobacter dublinensis 1210]